MPQIPVAVPDTELDIWLVIEEKLAPVPVQYWNSQKKRII
jgi:hypothetical protein